MASEIFSETKAGIEFSVHLIPGARKEQILGIIETERGIVIKISIHEKPTENNANEALIKFLAGRLNVAKTNVEIKRGHKSRDNISSNSKRSARPSENLKYQNNRLE